MIGDKLTAGVDKEVPEDWILMTIFCISPVRTKGFRLTLVVGK